MAYLGSWVQVLLVDFFYLFLLWLYFGVPSLRWRDGRVVKCYSPRSLARLVHSDRLQSAQVLILFQFYENLICWKFKNSPATSFSIRKKRLKHAFTMLDFLFSFCPNFTRPPSQIVHWLKNVYDVLPTVQIAAHSVPSRRCIKSAPEQCRG